MGVILEREKPRSVMLSVLYRLIRLPLSKKKKFGFFLDLEWIFDRLAHEMSFQYFEFDEHPARKNLLEFIGRHINKSHTVMDLGCNAGAISSLLAKTAKKVVGVDHNGEFIARAKANFPLENVEFIHGDALDVLNELDQKFDVLVLSHILEHLDNPKEFLQRFKGYFSYIYIELPDFDKYLLNHYRQTLNLPLIYTDNDHVREFDRYELKKILDECEIEILEAEYIFGIQRLWCQT